jgi:probable HAF family extracellular repeat protein
MDNQAVVWRHRVMKPIPTPAGGFGAIANGINDRGELLLRVYNPQGSAAYLWRRGQLTPVGTLPGDEWSRADWLNNREQIVGVSQGPNGYNGFVWRKGHMTALPSLDGHSAAARDINDRGQIVGQSATTADGLNPHAVLWTH